MRVSLVFTGFAPIASTLPAVHAAERHGLDGVWSAEHIGFHDAVTPSLLYLRETERLEIGLVGFSPASRHPALLAMEIASLAELAPGRIRVQVGTGDPSLVAKLGKPVRAPARSTATFVRALREALSGSDMNVEFPDYAFRGFKLAPLAPAPPIDVMAVRPKMIETAARVGDGVSLSVGASHAYLRDTVAAVERTLAEHKKPRASFRVTALSLGVIAKDIDAARAMVVPLLAMGEPSMVEHLTRGVFAPGEVTGAFARGGPFALAKLFTPEAIDEIALVTTPDKLTESLARYAATGIDELAVGIFAAPDELPAIVAELGRARAELRRNA
jgi:alkanesulfonate monooxygenase SsuD/methylene tetrahydromethanopterin reductase-like flavin-dependent oxidoreductase (luciferase family)